MSSQHLLLAFEAFKTDRKATKMSSWTWEVFATLGTSTIFVALKSSYKLDLIFLTIPRTYTMFAHGYFCWITQIVSGSIILPTTLYREGDKPSEYCTFFAFADGRNQTWAVCAASKCTVHYSIASATTTYLIEKQYFSYAI